MGARERNVTIVPVDCQSPSTMTARACQPFQIFCKIPYIPRLEPPSAELIKPNSDQKCQTDPQTCADSELQVLPANPPAPTFLQDNPSTAVTPQTSAIH